MAVQYRIMQTVRCFSNVTPELFCAEILPRRQPAIMKGLIADWSAVKLARQSDEALVGYLKSCDIDKPVNTILGPPTINGDLFYGENTKSFNFEQGRVRLSTALDRLLEQRELSCPHSIYVQSTSIREYLPKFLERHHLPCVPSNVEPRIWIGNAVRAQTHQDFYENIACVVAGRRRFTLFPPEQLVNLYIGPFESTLGGAAVSMVSIENPDMHRYPRFAEALKSAQYADLEPGDALFLPYGWWHHVRSKASFNVLVNYWWREDGVLHDAPQVCLLHALLSLRDLPRHQRDVWQVIFNYYVFGSHGDPVAHLQPEDQGALGKLSDTAIKKYRDGVVHDLTKMWMNSGSC